MCTTYKTALTQNLRETHVSSYYLKFLSTIFRYNYKTDPIRHGHYYTFTKEGNNSSKKKKIIKKIVLDMNVLIKIEITDCHVSVLVAFSG